MMSDEKQKELELQKLELEILNLQEDYELKITKRKSLVVMLSISGFGLLLKLFETFFDK